MNRHEHAGACVNSPGRVLGSWEKRGEEGLLFTLYLFAFHCWHYFNPLFSLSGQETSPIFVITTRSLNKMKRPK